MRDNKLFRAILYILLFGCIVAYIKLYILDSKLNIYIDLPKSVTDVKWYKYNDKSTLEFSVGNIKSTNKKLSKCTKYSYDKKSKIISLNCNEYSMKLSSVDKYKLVLTIDYGNKSNTITYYKYKEIIDYMNDNNLTTITNGEIEEKVDIPKKINDNDYINAEMNKLTVIKELTISDLEDKLKGNNSLILIINPNMKISSYDFIPIFISWLDIINDYSFYYINGKNININDQTLLDQFEDERIKDYVIGLNDLNIIQVKDNKYRFLNISINTTINHNKVFDCKDECKDIDLIIKDGDKEITKEELYK